MTNRTKLIDIVDDVNFMIVKFVDQIDPLELMNGTHTLVSVKHSLLMITM